MVTTASTIYLSLIGLTRLLLPLPGESLLRGLVYLTLAAATVPLWRRRLDWGSPKAVEGGSSASG